MSPPNLPERYARLLKPHSLGYGLYFPVPANNIRPGALGFFDDEGRWRTLQVDVRDCQGESFIR